jgi:FkbM family methyltransferase
MENFNLTLLIKNICPPIIWKVLKNLKKEKKYFGLNSLDQKIQKYFDYQSGFYLEIGANNGIEQSNTFFLEKEKNWNGVLIEPILHKYLECKKNRSNKNKFFCFACVSNDFKENFVELLYSNLMTIPLNLESDIKKPLEHASQSNAIRKKHNNTEIEVVKFIAKPRTMTSILNESKAPPLIDFFSLDVEGAEIEVLKGIDFSLYNFKYILVETRSIENITNYLESKKYNLIEKLSHHDYLFKFIKV